MRTTFVAIFATIALGGCAGFLAPAGVPVSKSLPEAARSVQTVINEANILITATANVVAQNAKEGLITETEKVSYRDKLKDMAKKVDSAQDLLRLGDITKAQTQADLIKFAITALHREVAAKARKQ